MPKPICVRCGLFMHNEQSGYQVIESMPTEDAQGKGLRAVGWKPYKLYVGDLWGCKRCHSQIVVGFSEVISEHFMPEFAELRSGEFRSALVVNDC